LAIPLVIFCCYDGDNEVGLLQAMGCITAFEYPYLYHG
jgi:hypothetical protein